MQDSTRRSFLAVAGTSAVAGVALAVAPEAASAATPESTTLPAQAEPALTAYVRNSSTGEVLLMGQGHEVLVTDRALVARLAHAFAAAKKG